MIFSLGMSLAKHKESILRERDRLNAEVEELNRRLQIQRIYSDEVEKKRMESENKNKELYKLLDVSVPTKLSNLVKLNKIINLGNI